MSDTDKLLGKVSAWEKTGHKGKTRVEQLAFWHKIQKELNDISPHGWVHATFLHSWKANVEAEIEKLEKKRRSHSA